MKLKDVRDLADEIILRKPLMAKEINSIIELHEREILQGHSAESELKRCCAMLKRMDSFNN